MMLSRTQNEKCAFRNYQGLIGNIEFYYPSSYFFSDHDEFLTLRTNAGSSIETQRRLDLEIAALFDLVKFCYGSGFRSLPTLKC
jgi:hypothetical protein